jgi:hypothetical protein
MWWTHDIHVLSLHSGKCLNANDQNLGFRCDLGVTSYDTRKGRAQTDWASNTGRRMKEI